MKASLHLDITEALKFQHEEEISTWRDGMLLLISFSPSSQVKYKKTRNSSNYARTNFKDV